MKLLRVLLLLTILVPLLAATPPSPVAPPFSIQVGLQASRPSDAVFRDIFASFCFSPQFGATLRVGDRWALHMDYTRFSRSGHPQILNENGAWVEDPSINLKGHQNLLVFMTGFCILPRPAFSLWIRGGFLLARFGEKGSELDESFSATGPVLDVELEKPLNRTLRAYGFLRWSTASRNTSGSTQPDGPTLRAGGLSLGLGASLSLVGR